MEKIKAPRVSEGNGREEMTTTERGCDKSNQYMNITVASYWARWRPKSQASRFIAQQFVQAQLKENIKAPRHWPFLGNPPAANGFPSQRAGYA